MKNKLLIVLVILMAITCQTGCSFVQKFVPTSAVSSPAEQSQNGQASAKKAVASKTPPPGSDTFSEISTAAKSESTSEDEKSSDDKITAWLSGMTLEEKVAQLFIVVPEDIIEGIDCVTAAGEATEKAIHTAPVGGFLYLGQNLVSATQTKQMLENVQRFSMERTGLPMFLCIDEEGGAVARISGNESFGIPAIEDMAVIGSRGNEQEAYETGTTIGAYLKELGFNMDFAPVADVLTNQDNQVVKKRSFGNDPELVSRMAQELSRGLADQGILYAYKHFPGHGNTSADTHEGYAFTDKTLEELRKCELLPFQKAIEHGVPFIMVGHISIPNITDDHTPASLSREMIEGLLRDEMGYNGIVITDALNMGAVTQQYSSSEAAIKALQAGVDMILMPEDFDMAYQGILDAISSGDLSEERIDESLSRILQVKLAQ